MSRWKVCRQNTMFYNMEDDTECYGPRWCVYSPTGVSWGIYATWAEAMERADSQARTVTLTIPRHSYKAAPFFLAGGLHGSTTLIIHESTPEQHIILPSETLKPLALALLTKHYKEQQQ